MASPSFILILPQSFPSIPTSQYYLSHPYSAEIASSESYIFHDCLPVMADKLGGDGLTGEFCSGFNLLMDRDKALITFESLIKRNSCALGLQDLRSMLKEGDFDGDGALTQMDFCVLMFRLSPQLMQETEFLLEQALLHELNHFSY